MSTTALRVANGLSFYACGTVMYGFIRSTTYDYKKTERYFNEKTRSFEVKEMLYVDKAGRVLFNSLAAVTVWPFMVLDDFKRLECKVRGVDSEEYGVKPH
jgi:hypothetical protein